MAPQKTGGASLLPGDFTSGGAVADGEYTIKAIAASTFDYGGTVEAGPSLLVSYEDDAGAVVDQNYSAGKITNLIPSDDGKRFVHPSGDEAHISKSSNAAAWLASIIGASFPTAGLSDDVSAFAGTRVYITNVAQPKRPGIKDAVEGKTIPLVTKILALPGASKVRPTQTAARATSVAAKTAPAAKASPSDNNLDEAAITAVQEALSVAENATLPRIHLGTRVWLTAQKAKNPDAIKLKKLVSDSAWLAANAESGGWATDGETVSLGTE